MPGTVPAVMTASWPAPWDLLPHGPAACCIDAIEGFSPGASVTARWHVHAGSVLYDPARGGVPAWAGIEIMAQCAGLYLGLARGGAGRRNPPGTGYLVGVRGFRAGCEVFPEGSNLRIEAVCRAAEVAAGELGSFECRILCGETEGARARLMLWCADDSPGDP